jgi:lincosamide nucleotidyltransferase A/C/D/E
MSGDDVVELVRLLEGGGVSVCVDGGWGVDALLGEQTRPHADLDIAVPHAHVPALRAALAARGYEEIQSDGAWECNFVLADREGHRVDVHSYVFDGAGNHGHGIAYPLDSLVGTGTINGVAVTCIAAEWMMRFHGTYEPDEKHFHDVSALQRRFGIAIPAAYHGFRAAGMTEATP